MNMMTYPLKQKLKDETGIYLTNIKCSSPTKPKKDNISTVLNKIFHLL